MITGLLAGYLREQARRAEDALQRRVAELQDAYRDLAGAHEQLKTVDKLKTSFLTNVSHELRTPLTSIRAFGEMLTAYELPREEVHEFGGVITIESERLTRLVNDLLDLSKIEAGQMEWRFEPLDLTEVLRWCGRQIRPVLAAKGVVYLEEFEADLPAVEGDRDRLQQVIANLLHNASKFTPSGSIALCAFADEEALTVEVRDTGIGIPASDLERVFDKFQQVGDTLTDKPHGTELGLAICRDIINYHNGRIWVESVLGQGSVFTFTLR